MNKRNQLVCYNEYGNTGRPFCEEDLGPIYGGIFAPKRRVFTRDEIADIEQTLNDGAIEDLASQRLFFVGPYDDLSPSGTDPVKETFNLSGRVRRVRRGTIGRDLTVATGGWWMNTAHMNALDGKPGQYSLLEIYKSDSGFKIVGTTKDDANGRDGLGGFDLSDLTVGDYTAGNGQTGDKWIVSYQLADESQWNKRHATVDIDFNPLESIQGLQTVEIENVTPLSAGTASHIRLVLSAGGVNLKDVYGAALAQTGVYDIIDVATGNPVVVSAVSAATDDYYDLTLTSGTGKTVIVRGKAPSVLAALTTSVLGLEFKPSKRILVP